MAKLPGYFKNAKTKYNPEKNTLDLNFKILWKDLFSIDSLRPSLREIFGNRKNFNRFVDIITKRQSYDFWEIVV